LYGKVNKLVKSTNAIDIVNNTSITTINRSEQYENVLVLSITINICKNCCSIVPITDMNAIFILYKTSSDTKQHKNCNHKELCAEQLVCFEEGLCLWQLRDIYMLDRECLSMKDCVVYVRLVRWRMRNIF
jgi:hypothetical protein